jgi:hypothetical protein
MWLARVCFTTRVRPQRISLGGQFEIDDVSLTMPPGSSSEVAYLPLVIEEQIRLLV